MFVITLAQHYRQSRNKIERCCGRVRASSNISIVWHYFAQSPHPQSLRKKVLCAASREKGTTHNLNSTPTNRHSIRIWPKQRSRHNSCLLYIYIYIYIIYTYTRRRLLWYDPPLFELPPWGSGQNKRWASNCYVFCRRMICVVFRMMLQVFAVESF